jgi:genome maintenance exonuclease 1
MALTVDISNKRHYFIPGQEKPVFLPSVTTIIGTMSDKSGLDVWRKKVGEEKADQISKFSANRGTVMHTHIENYLAHESEDKKVKLLESLKKTSEESTAAGFTKEEMAIGRKLFYNFYLSNTFDKVKRVVMQEEMLWSLNGGGYAGRTDNIYEDHDSLHVVSDFKTSRKPKKEEWIDGYKLQISAYYVAYWELYGVRPDRCEIWISNEEDSTPQIFTLTKGEVKYWYGKFIEMVKAYHQKYGSEIKEYIEKIPQNELPG